MKVSRVESETFWFEFFKRVLAANTRFLLMVTAWLVLAALDVAAQTPTITIDGATNVTAFGATITGTINPNGQNTLYLLQWGTTTACDHVGGYMSVLTQNTPVAVSNQLTGLSPNTTYHYQLFATNDAGGASLSPDMTVTTLPPVPVVTANAPLDVTMTSAFIPGAVNPNGLTTQAYFQWGTTPAYGNTVRVGTDLTGNIPLGAGTSLTGLMPNTTYHYQFFATNTAGNGSSGDLTVTTLAEPPTPITGGASSITTNSASISGTVSNDSPSNIKTAYYFRWGSSPAYGNTTPLTGLEFGTYLSVSASLSGLSPGTTYHYQLVVTNDGATKEGADMTFTTWADISIAGQLFTYWVDNGAVSVVGYNGPGGSVTIPGTINGLPVTTIGPAAFADSAITDVKIPNSVTTIGQSAFYGSAVTNVTIPNSVTTIGVSAFNGCFAAAGGSTVRTAHLDKGMPAGGNVCFLDNHVVWRKYVAMTNRISPRGLPQFEF